MLARIKMETREGGGGRRRWCFKFDTFHNTNRQLISVVWVYVSCCSKGEMNWGNAYAAVGASLPEVAVHGRTTIFLFLETT
jgi:hypothetical protein